MPGEIGLMVDPDTWKAKVFHGEQAGRLRLDLFQVLHETLETGICFPERLEVSSVEIVVVAVENKPNAMVKYRTPRCKTELTFHHTRETIIRGPTVEKISVEGYSLTECPDKPGGETRIAESKIDPVKLVPPVAAVLLSLPSNTVNHRLLRRIHERVDGGINQLVEFWVACLQCRWVSPWIEPSMYTDVAEFYGPTRLAYEELNPFDCLVIECLKCFSSSATDEPAPSIEMGVEEHRAVLCMSLLHKEFYYRPGRRLDRKEGIPDDFIVQLKCQRERI